MKKYCVVENNAGMLFLVVFAENGKIEYVHSGYEFSRMELAEGIASLYTGSNPVEDWDGNEVDELGNNFYHIFPEEEKGIGWTIVKDIDGAYLEKMGENAKNELVYNIFYGSGNGAHPEKEAVDYMLFNFTEFNKWSTIDRLYAEMEARGDDSTYEPLKREIIEQAKKYGICENQLIFWYD